MIFLINELPANRDAFAGSFKASPAGFEAAHGSGRRQPNLSVCSADQAAAIRVQSRGHSAYVPDHGAHVGRSVAAPGMIHGFLAKSGLDLTPM